MSNPIIDSSALTEEQKDTIYIYYKEAETDKNNPYNESIQLIGYSRILLLEALFGKKLFKQKRKL